MLFLVLTECSYYVFPIVCPSGMVEYAGRTCIKLITTAASKSDAESQCQALSDESRLVTIKNGFEQKAIEEFLKDNSVTEDVYVGATYTTNQWLWSDGSPVFTTCKQL